MTSQQLRIQMSGGGPYGFRLIGGDTSPLTVAKIRPSSKAHVAGLLEGDVILAINNICSKGLSHATATGLLEGSNAGLTVYALRGRSALSDADSAMTSLSREIKRLTEAEVSAIVQGQSTQAAASNDYLINKPLTEATFRLHAPPSGGTLKQMRISRSSDVPAPNEIAASENPGYYTREERTSTDGGKTTRIVEEVKTEKFGGTTLTKVTKKEFTSYDSTTSGPNNINVEPQYSIVRREEQPALLGAPIHQKGGSGEANEVRDERGWTISSSVEKSNVRTQPYEVRFKTNQEPVRSWTVYQDEPDRERSDGSRITISQPVSAIEIQFQPNARNFVMESRTSDEVQPFADASTNFEVRTGNEIRFQPRLQSNSTTGQSQYKYQPTQTTRQIQESKFTSHTGDFSKFNLEPEQKNPQQWPGIDSEIQYNAQSIPNRRPDFRPQHEGNIDSLYKSGTIIREPYNRQQEQEFKYSNHPQINFEPEPQHGYNPVHSTFAFSSEPQSQLHPRVKASLHYNPEPEAPNQIAPDTHKALTLQAGLAPWQQHLTGPVHLKGTPSDKFDSRSSYNPGTNALSGYSVTPQSPKKLVNRPLNYNSEPQWDARAEFGYGPEPRKDPNVYDEAKPHAQSYYENYEQSSLSRQIKPVFHDNKPASQVSTVLQGTYAPREQYSAAPVHLKGAPYFEPREAIDEAYPLVNNNAGQFRQMDRVERVEVATTPQWIPGSKLLTKQPTRPTGSNYPLGSDFRGVEWKNQEHQGQITSDGSMYNRPTEDGWHGSSAVEVKTLPSVALSQVFEPKKQVAETHQYFASNKNEQYRDESHVEPAYGGYDYCREMPDREAKWSLNGQHIQPCSTMNGRFPGTANVWRPPAEVSGQKFGYKMDGYDEVERERASVDVGNDPYYQPVAVLQSMETEHPPAAPHMISQKQAPAAPPPPVAPPIDLLKIYRGNSSSDRGYGLTSFEERVKMANSVAHSVLSPENKNSRGQKLFLRRREHSHKWTTQGPDPVPEKATPQEPTINNPNIWTPAQQARPLEQPHSLGFQPKSLSVYPDGRVPIDPSSNAGYNLASDMTSNSGKGDLLFAKKRAKAERWTSVESTGRQTAPPSDIATLNAYRNDGPQNQNYGQSTFYSAADGRREGPGAGEQIISNRLKDMIKPQPSAQIWNQQAPSQSLYTQDGQSRGVSYTGSIQTATGYRPIKFQGTSAISSSLSVPSVGQPSRIIQSARPAPKQFGRITVSQSLGYADL